MCARKTRDCTYAEKDGTEYLEQCWTEKFILNESSPRHLVCSLNFSQPLLQNWRNAVWAICVSSKQYEWSKEASHVTAGANIFILLHLRP